MGRRINRSGVQTIRIFRQAYGITPYQFLLGQKLTAACELLTHSHQSVKEIADYLGFADEFYFSRLFKQKIGVSPSNYRDQRNH